MKNINTFEFGSTKEFDIETPQFFNYCFLEIGQSTLALSSSFVSEKLQIILQALQTFLLYLEKKNYVFYECFLFEVYCEILLGSDKTQVKGSVI